MRNRHALIGIVLSSVLALAAISGAASAPSDVVSIYVDATQKGDPLKHVWQYYGYDECNYTTAPDCLDLMKTVAQINAHPTYLREHFLLNSGDGAAALKWGSTNAYTEDKDGRPVYSWQIMDSDHGRRGGLRLPAPGRDRLHAQGPVKPAGALPKFGYLQAGRRLLLSSQGLREMGRADPPVGPPQRRTIQGRGGDLAVGALERAGHRLLARHARGIPQAIRLHGESPARGAASRDAGRTSYRRHRQISSQFPRALCERNESCLGKTGHTAGLHRIPRQGRRLAPGRPRANEPGQSVAAAQPGLRGRGRFPAVSQDTPIIIGEADPDGCAGCPSSQFPERAYRNVPPTRPTRPP